MRRTRDTEYSSTTRDFYPSNSSKPYLGHAPSSSEGFTNRLLSSNRGNQPSERLAPSIATAIYDQSSQNLKPKYLQPTVHPYSEKTQTAGAWRSGSKDRPLMGADQFIRTATESVRSGWEYPAQSNQKFVAAQYAEPVHRLPLGHAHYTPNETYGSQWQTHHHSNQAGPQVIYDTCDRDRGLPRSVSYENLRRTADAISGFADLRVEPAPHPALQEPLYTPGYLGPCFFDYKHTLARHPSMLDCVEDRTNANRMSQDLSTFDVTTQSIWIV